MKKVEYDTNIYDTIRKNIKKYRLEKGLTAAQLAEMVGLSHEFIRQIESCSAKTSSGFSIDTLYRISVALDTSLDKFVEKEN